jgi:diguanylate cyclase (GGDEF)-like protein
MQKNLLDLLCRKSSLSYIVFDKDFCIVDAKSPMIEKSSDVRNFLWEIVGLEEHILALPTTEESLEIPMLLRGGDYYDLTIEYFEKTTNGDLFIIYIQQKQKQTYEYANVIKEINKKTLLMETKKNLRTISFHVDIDTLTGLANRHFFLKSIDKFIAEEDSFNICFIDIDQFHIINEEYGAHAGDMLLKHITALLESLKKENDLLARVEGDLFALLFESQKSQESISILIKEINNLKNTPLNYSAEDTIEFTLSTLLLSYPTDAQSAKEFLQEEAKKMKKLKIDKKLSR